MFDIALPMGEVMIAPYSASFLSGGSCITNGYYGTYGMQSVFIPDFACLESESYFAALPDLSAASFAPISVEIKQLVWLEEAVVEDNVKVGSPSFDDEFSDFLGRLTALGATDYNVRVPGQEVFETNPTEYGFKVLHTTETHTLLSVAAEFAAIIDTILPRFWKSTLLPTSPVPYVPVPSPAIDHVKDLLSSLRFDPVVASVVNNISLPQMKNDLHFLTGEDGKSGIVSRHSFAAGSRTAAAWLKDRFEDTGAKCELKPFLTGFAPNVVCRYPSTVNTTATVLLSAHYDSRGSFGSTRAPGGDDDGSGTSGLLSIARTIARKGVTFRSNVELVAFAGEEQGLLGSKAYARELKEAGANITVMIQADMLGYHAPGEPPQLGLPDLIGTAEVTQLVANISAIYSPELKVGFTPACCSDHQSFHEQGFPSTQVFERAGPIADPMYHNSGDLSEREGYDFDQVKLISKVQFATLLHAAGYDLPK